SVGRNRWGATRFSTSCAGSVSDRSSVGTPVANAPNSPQSSCRPRIPGWSSTPGKVQVKQGRRDAWVGGQQANPELQEAASRAGDGPPVAYRGPVGPGG